MLKRLKKLKCISAIVLKIKFHTISMTTIFHREICYVKNVNPPLFTSVMYRSRYSTDWSQNKGENRKTVLINKFTRYSCNRYNIPGLLSSRTYVEERFFLCGQQKKNLYACFPMKKQDSRICMFSK